MKDVLALIIDLNKKSVTIKAEGAQLKVTGNTMALTQDDKDRITTLKPYILLFFKEHMNLLTSEFYQINLAEKHTWYPLSSAQRRIWVLSQYENGNAAYNMPGAFEFGGELDWASLLYAFESLIKRHEILRTVFNVNESGEIRQFVQPFINSDFVLTRQDLRREKNQKKRLREIVQSDFRAPFNLETGPLLRASMFQVDDTKWVLSFITHHLISDEWSMGIFIKEFFLLYNSYSKGDISPLVPLRIQYKDYAVWQQNQLLGEQMAVQRAYWSKQLEGALPILELPIDKPRPSVKTYSGNVARRMLPKELTEGLKSIGHEQGGTLYMMVLALVNLLLYRYTNQADIIIGSPIAGRNHIDLEDQIGLYINMLALRTRFEGTDSFKELVSKTMKTTLDAYEHQSYPFDELIDLLALPRDISRNALFDVMVTLQNEQHNHVDSPQEVEMASGSVCDYQIGELITSKFDLTFAFVETVQGLSLSIEYNTDLFEQSSIERMGVHLESLLSALVAEPLLPLQQVGYLSESERHQLLVDFNATTTEWDSEQTLVSLFEHQVSLTPQAVALVSEQDSVSYEELNQRANQLAHYLRGEHGVEAGTLVGIQLERSEWLVVAMLSVLKAGGAYVPIDPDYPAARQAYLRTDSGCEVVLEAAELAIFQAGQYASTNLDVGPQPSDLAYVIYTSGSTGQPKGVMIEHRSVNAFLLNLQKSFSLSADTVLGATTNFTFDISVLELLGSLTLGMRVVLLSSTDPIRILQQLTDHSITALQLTPSRLSQLVDASPMGFQALAQLNVLLVGGEALSQASYEHLKQLPVQVFNVYGPTETTIWSSVFALNTSKGLSIGRPLLNETIYILDGGLGLQPVGVVGELCISGAGLARGYLNQSVLTAEKFVTNPYYQEDQPASSARLYRTGDQARWREDGTIEFLGRQDEQVKLRGYRIELGEIEAVLSSHPQLSQAVVMACQLGESDKQLVAYLVGSDPEVSGESLRAYLTERLPAYMIPSQFVLLEALPLTVNGKVDKKALPDPQGISLSSAREYLAARTPIEQTLVDIWEQVLRKERVGVLDNFFELGGHSLKVIQVISRIHQTLDVKLELMQVFTHPTLAGQAELIGESLQQVYQAIEPVAASADYALSHAQQRLWIQEQQGASFGVFNIPMHFQLIGELDRGSLEHAFEEVVARHESLRTVFVVVEGEPRQRILSVEEAAFVPHYQDLRSQADPEQVAIKLADEQASAAFDLSQGPLLRVKLLQTDEQTYCLLLTIHHIVSDEWSMQVLVREVLSLYGAYHEGLPSPLSALPIQYKDYVAWQQGQLSGAALLAHQQYWLEQLSGEVPLLELPTDRPRPALQTYRGSSHDFTWPAELSGELEALSQQQGVTLFMVLLAGLNTLLYRYSGQSDLIVGSPIAGRQHADLEEQIGYYLNTLALRTQVDGQGSFVDLLKGVKQTTLGAYAHQAYPFDRLVEDLQLVRDPSRSPLFDVVLILQNVELGSEPDLALPGVAVESLGAELHISKGDLRFQFAQQGQTLLGSIEYNTDLFDAARIERMSAHLLALMQAIVTQPTRPLQELTYQTEEELRQGPDFGARLSEPAWPLIHTVIEQQCVLAPQAIALEQEGERLSYGQLNAASNQLAHLLLGLGIQPQQAVAVALPAGIQAVRSLLACLKAGALYLPLELGFAAQRLRQMLTDLQPSVLLVGAEQQAIAEALLAELACPVAYLLVLPSPQLDWLGDLSLSDRQLIDLSDQVRVLAYGPQGYQLSPQSTLSEPQHNPDLDLDPQGHNYVFYTSGSTGQGKAIVGTHRSLSHYIHWHMAQWGIDAQFRISQLAPLTFDASLKDILVALAAGATLCIPQVSTRQNMEQLANWLVSSRVTLLACVPSVFRLLQTALVGRAVPALPQLRYVLLSGERLYGRDVLNWQAVNGQHSELTNLYGLTETTILKTYYRLPHWDWQPGEVVPVGKPISNTSLAVVNGNHLSGREIVGEIYIKSPFLSAGYLDASLNAGMFIQNPLVSDRVDLVCRTGDMGRYRSDGNLEVLGRQDEQVKLHGIRVELGEVRGAVLSLEGIVQVELVVQQSAEGNGELVCYYQGTHRSGEQFREALAGLLNGYMIPAYYEWLEQFPLTLNGKVDRKALPLPVALESSYEAPQGALEEQLARIWQQVLGIPRVSRRESFFNLGGSSLKAIQLISRLYKELEIQLQIGEVFAHPTLAGQAELIGESLQQVYQAIEPVAASADYALSHGQKRLWIQEQLQQHTSAFNGLELFQLIGELDRGSLEHAFEEVVARHESLRTVFVVVEEEPRQRILSVEEAAFVLHYQDLRSQADAHQHALALSRQEIALPFDLSQGPLLRVKLLQTDEQTYCLLLTIHHIVSDEWSMQVLVREVLSLYGAYHEGLPSPLSALPIQYKDYVAWQQGQLSGAALLAHQQYWLEQLSGEVPLLELPTDRPRPALQTYRGSSHDFTWPAELSGELEALSQQQGVTLFMVLLAGLNTLLYRYSGQSDLIVGSPIAGRQHADLEEQIGYYLNTLALRTQVDGQGSFVDLLKGVKQTTLGAYAHQAYPFDRLVEDLQLVRDPSRSPLFDVVLILQNVELGSEPDLALPGVAVESLGAELRTSKGDLRFQFAQQGQTLLGSIEYNTDLFDAARIERMSAHLLALMQAIVTQPTRPLQELTYLQTEEVLQEQMDLNNFNTILSSEF